MLGRGQPTSGRKNYWPMKGGRVRGGCGGGGSKPRGSRRKEKKEKERKERERGNEILKILFSNIWCAIFR